MIQLCLIVLGKEIPNYTFHVPHACSNSRWMAKVIYSIKIYLFRHQLDLTQSELEQLKDICLFISLVYAKPWIQCCIPSNAPYNDLKLLKQLTRYSSINKRISENALSKFNDHLWYLGPETVVLSLFSSKVSDTDKQNMIDKMKLLDNEKWESRNWRLNICKDAVNKKLEDFVDSSSLTVLKSLQLDVDFMLNGNVIEWKNTEQYTTVKNVVWSMTRQSVR